MVITHGGIGIWIDVGGCENISEGLIGLMTMMEGCRVGIRVGDGLSD